MPHQYTTSSLNHLNKERCWRVLSTSSSNQAIQMSQQKSRLSRLHFSNLLLPNFVELMQVLTSVCKSPFFPVLMLGLNFSRSVVNTQLPYNKVAEACICRLTRFFRFINWQSYKYTLSLWAKTSDFSAPCSILDIFFLLFPLSATSSRYATYSRLRHNTLAVCPPYSYMLISIYRRTITNNKCMYRENTLEMIIKKIIMITIYYWRPIYLDKLPNLRNKLFLSNLFQ